MAHIQFGWNAPVIGVPLAAAWAEGRALTLEQAIAYALEATGPQ